MHLFLRSEFWRILRTTIWTRWCASDFLIKLWNYCAFLFFVICSIVMFIFGLEVWFFRRENNGKSPTKYGSPGEFPHRICALIPTKRVLAYFWSHYFRSLMYMFFFIIKTLNDLAFLFFVTWSLVLSIFGLEVRFLWWENYENTLS